MNHAQSVAIRVFDERVRDRGFYHVLRLPSFWENQIHAAFRSGALTNLMESTEPLEILQASSGVEPNASDAREGALDLGSLDLTRTASLKRLSSTHADAIAGNKLVIPYFELA